MDDNYIKNLLKRTLDSYKIIKGLKDKPCDLVTINEELGKIQGLLQVAMNTLSKVESFVNTGQPVFTLTITCEQNCKCQDSSM